jgi:hypothetical protein
VNTAVLCILLAIFGQTGAAYNSNSLDAVWRISFGVGLVPVTGMLVYRLLFLQESKVWIRQKKSSAVRCCAPLLHISCFVPLHVLDLSHARLHEIADMRCLQGHLILGGLQQGVQHFMSFLACSLLYQAGMSFVACMLGPVSACIRLESCQVVPGACSALEEHAVPCALSSASGAGWPESDDHVSATEASCAAA